MRTRALGRLLLRIATKAFVLAMVLLALACGAFFLTTLTTVCGFSGILFANHRGLQSMAWAAVAGMILALVASVILLPATLWVAEGLASRRRGAHDGGVAED